MSFVSDMAKNRARLQALAPYMTQAQTSVAMNLLNMFGSWSADNATAVTNSASGIAYTTASGTALRNKAQDYNVSPSAGQAATIAVWPYLQTVATQLVNVPSTTVVGTGGNSVSTPAVNFTLQTAATIAIGAIATGAPVQAACTQAGVIGNIAAGTITQSSLSPNTGVLVTNNVQLVTITGSPTGGTFTLTFSGQTTAAIAYNAAASAVQTALAALSTIGAGNVVVYGAAGGPYSIGLINALGPTPQPLLSASAAGLTGGSPVITITAPGAGSGGVDPATDPAIRSAIATHAKPLNANQQAVAAMLAVPSVAYAYLYDPSQNGASPTGSVYWYAAKADGTLDGIPGGTSVVAASMPSNPPYLTIGAGGLSGTAAAVLGAVQGVVSWAIVRAGGDGGAASPFTVIYITNVTLTYLLQPGAQASTVDPLIGTAITAYLQGLGPGNPPTTWGIYQAVNAGTGGAVLNITALSMTPNDLNGSGTDGNGIPQLYLPSSGITYTITP